MFGEWQSYFVNQIVCHYGYLTVFAIVGLESAGLLLPGEITLVAAGIAAGSAGVLNITWVITAAAMGSILGGAAGYWVGRRFGLPLLLRYGRRMGLSERQLRLGQYLFLRHGGKVVFFGRLLTILRVLAALMAGMNRMPWARFLMSSIAGGIAWSLLFGGGGFVLGQRIHSMTGPVGLASLAIGILAFIVIGLYLNTHKLALEEAAERALPGPLGNRL